MQKKMKNRKSLKRRSEPVGWTVTEDSVPESNELYQVKQSEIQIDGETQITDSPSKPSTESNETEIKGKKKLKKGVVIQRSEASQNISEFNLTEVGKEKVKLNELIKTSQQISGQVSVKKQLEGAKKLKSLAIPLSKPQLEKIKRGVAYDKVCSEVTRWEKVVNNNRSAEQIIFPLKKPALQIEPFDKVSEGYVTKHPVEIAVAALLNKSENKLEAKKSLTAAEEKALQAMSLEEAKLRHQDLMKHRALISYQEMKARRQNKIKSKRYHRILKKEKLKKLMKEFETLENTDASAAIEKLMEADKLRVMERMTLKHRNTGKWAKMQKIRAKYNPEARSVLKQDVNIGKELKSKVPEIESQISRLRSKIEAGIEDEDEDLEDGLIEEPEAMSMEDLDEIVPPLELEPSTSESRMNKFSLEKHLDQVKEMTNVAKPAPKSTETTSDFVDMEFISKATTLNSYNPSSVTVGDQMDALEDQSGDEEGVTNLSEAFADEDIIAEFREDKKASEEAKKAKGLDLFLPGWGSWGGEGIKDNSRNRKRFYIEPLEEPKKRTLGNVIVNENASKKAAMHQVSHLPFPFSNVRQFESHIAQPVGHTWNPQSSFQSLTAPKVRTRTGKVIDPITAEDVLLGKVVEQKIEKRRRGNDSKRRAF